MEPTTDDLPPDLPPDLFGERADRYDETSAAMFAPEVLDPTVDLLAELAGDGAALELAIGTGRVALPLAARGVPVHGIDLSAPMLDRLRAKPGADAVGLTVGDFSRTVVEGRFTLVYLVFNTLMNLTSQQAQVDCFRTAAAHLEPGGCFLVEVMVPELRRLPPGQDTVAFQLTDRVCGVDVYEVAEQRVTSVYYEVDDGTGRPGRRSETPFRYVWPAELDLMARLAGLRLRHRWQDWRRTPFTGESRSHVSVWQRP